MKITERVKSNSIENIQASECKLKISNHKSDQMYGFYSHYHSLQMCGFFPLSLLLLSRIVKESLWFVLILLKTKNV